MRTVTLAEVLSVLGTREEIERVIEGMIQALDDLDGDPDCEPSLGSVGGTAEDLCLNQTGWALGKADDSEFDVIDAGLEA